jgi:hypothetical protein
MGLFKPAWQSKDNYKKQKYFEKLADNTTPTNYNLDKIFDKMPTPILLEFALRKYYRVRGGGETNGVAIICRVKGVQFLAHRLNEKELLKMFISNYPMLYSPSDHDLRTQIFNNVSKKLDENDNNNFAILTGHDSFIQNVKNPSVLFEIIKRGNSRAVKYLENQDMLAELVAHDIPIIRFEAIEKLNNQKILLDIANNIDLEIDLRIKAAEKLTDPPNEVRQLIKNPSELEKIERENCKKGKHTWVLLSRHSLTIKESTSTYKCKYCEEEKMEYADG